MLGKKQRGKRAGRKAARAKHKAARARSRLDELTFGTFNVRTAALNGVVNGIGKLFWRGVFSEYISVPLPFSPCMESGMSYVSPFRMVFFYHVTTGWISYINLLCENSIKNEKYLFIMLFHPYMPSPSETWFRGMSVGGSFRRV